MSQSNQILGIPSMLSQIGFGLTIAKAPLMSAMAYEVTTPDISAGFATIPTPFKDIPVTPDKLAYGDVQVSFKVDENLENYLEMLNWIKGITFPNDFSQYRTASTTQTRDGIYSDGALIILSNGGRPCLEYTFQDMFPINLSPITLNTQDEDVQYISAQVSFKIRDFQIRSLL